MSAGITPALTGRNLLRLELTVTELDALHRIPPAMVAGTLMGVYRPLLGLEADDSQINLEVQRGGKWSEVILGGPIPEDATAIRVYNGAIRRMVEHLDYNPPEALHALIFGDPVPYTCIME